LGHTDEVFDIAFNSTGTKLASVSADGTGRVYNVVDNSTQVVLVGHTASISKVRFNG
jgi:dynein assembly factor with WDR repeat domains 1